MRASILDLANGREYYLIKSYFTFGRSKYNDICIDNTYVSRKHCKISKKDNKYLLEDLKTSNGTYLNWEKINSKEELSDGDTITLSSKGPKFQFKLYKNNKTKKTSSSKPKIKISKNLKSKIILFSIIFAVSILLLFSVNFAYFKFIKPALPKTIIKDKQIEDHLIDIMERYGEEDFYANKEFIKKIKYYINFYDNTKSFQTGLQRRKKYIKMIEKTFTKHKIPKDLSYIAFVESNYDPKAYNSFSGARGMWQFMKPTGRQYGLIINKKVDERINPEKSTEAAAEYINDLLSIFGVNSFTLAIAAYNAGDGTLRSSLRQIDDPLKHRNFWYLYKNNLIPEETKEYVLKILALMILCEEIYPD